MRDDLLLRVALVLALLLAVVASCAGAGPRDQSLHRHQPQWPIVTTARTAPVRLLPMTWGQP